MQSLQYPAFPAFIHVIQGKRQRKFQQSGLVVNGNPCQLQFMEFEVESLENLLG